VLLVVAGIGFAGQGAIHVAQAHSLEAAKNYARAVSEYQAGGAGAADLARAYNEWGEQLAASGQYTTAIAKFDVVINSYNSVSDQVTRAKTDEAKAYYQVGQKALNSGDYAGAVAAFQTLVTKFPSDPSATQAHALYATALLGLGKSQLGGGGSGCDTALPTYQQLAKDFADTPEGKEADTDLKAPQPVRGQFTGKVSPPSGQTALAFLLPSTSATAKGYATPIDKSSGVFEFGPVPQDSYNLGAGFGTFLTKRGMRQSLPPYPCVVSTSAHLPLMWPLKRAPRRRQSWTLSLRHPCTPKGCLARAIRSSRQRAGATSLCASANTKSYSTTKTCPFQKEAGLCSSI
jgi:hypothetical protein